MRLGIALPSQHRRRSAARARRIPTRDRRNAISGDERFFAGTPHVDAVGAHVDFVEVVKERQSHTTAGEHDLLPAEAGARQGDIAARFAVKAIEKNNDDGDYDKRTDDTK